MYARATVAPRRATHSKHVDEVLIVDVEAVPDRLSQKDNPAGYEHCVRSEKKQVVAANQHTKRFVRYTKRPAPA